MFCYCKDTYNFSNLQIKNGEIEKSIPPQKNRNYGLFFVAYHIENARIESFLRLFKEPHEEFMMFIYAEDHVQQ